MIPTLVLFAVLFLACFKMGKKNFVATILGFYPALVLMNNSPLEIPDSASGAFTYFVLFWVVATFLIRRVITDYVGFIPSKKYAMAALFALAVFWQFVLVVTELAPFALPFEISDIVLNLIPTMPIGVALVLPLLSLLIAERE